MTRRGAVVGIMALLILTGSAYYFFLGEGDTAPSLGKHALQDHFSSAPVNLGNSSPRPATEGASLFGALASPFGALDCTKPGSMLSHSAACNDDKSASPSTELSAVAILRNAIAELSENNLSVIYEINSMFGACTHAQLDTLTQTGLDRSVDKELFQECTADNLSAATRAVESVLATFKPSSATDEAKTMWLVGQEHLFRLRAGGGPNDATTSGSTPHSRALVGPLANDYKALRKRLREHLENMRDRSESDNVLLEQLRYEDDENT